MIYIYDKSPGGFEWDAHNVAHVARHGLQPADVEQALAGESVTLGEGPAGVGEPRWVSVGPTDAGRLVTVVWTVRGARVRVVTAYPTGKWQQVAYERAKAGSSGAEVSPDPKLQDRG